MNTYELTNQDLLKITKRLQRDFDVPKVIINEDYERNLLLVLEQVMTCSRLGYMEYALYTGVNKYPRGVISKLKNLANIITSLVNEVTTYRFIHDKFPMWYFDPTEFLAWAYRYNAVFIFNKLDVEFNDLILKGIIKYLSSIVYLKDAKKVIADNRMLSLGIINGFLSRYDWANYTLDGILLVKITLLKNKVKELLSN